MPVTNDFQSFGIGAGSNVVTPATWATTTARFTGFQSGVASSALVNTALRQTSSVTTMIAQFIADTLAQSVADNGNLATLEAQFIAAIQLSVGSPAQAAFWHFGHDTGPVNVMQVTASPVITAYGDGMTVSTFPHFSNTTSNPTLSANGLAATVIVHNDGTALNAGDISVNTAIVFEYDAGASVWRIISASAVPQASQLHFGADVGTANALIVSTVNPPIAAVTTGMAFIIKKGAAANTGAMTLTIAGTAGALTWGDDTAFTGGEWPAAADGFVMYDGNYRMIGPPSPNFRAHGTTYNLVQNTNSTRVVMSAGANTPYTAWTLPTYSKLSSGSTLLIQSNLVTYVPSVGPGIMSVVVNGTPYQFIAANNRGSQFVGGTSGLLLVTGVAAGAVTILVQYEDFNVSWGAEFNPNSTDNSSLPAATTSTMIISEIAP